MFRDPRGGCNRNSISEDFFKKWNPNMAYVLGLILADGAIEDVRKSSRTCYIAITSNDISLLNQVRSVFNSQHKIYHREPRMVTFPSGKSYLCKKTYILRIGNKKIYQDLIDLGITPRKSLTIKLPEVPDKFFSFFLRGYFDGDGCVSTHIPKGRVKKTVSVTFTSGSKKLLLKLSTKIYKLTDSSLKNIYSNGHALQLSYKKIDSLKILKYMYRDLKLSPFLDRKYLTY
jgi:hypothetical protein